MVTDDKRRNMNSPTREHRRLVVLGVDAATPDLVRRFIAEGHLPNMARLLERGAYTRHRTTFPTLTAPAWNALSTGAGIGTTGIPSLTIKLPGEPLDTLRSAFDSSYAEAQTLWQSAGEEGLTTALVNWPVTWPAKPLNGVQIAGSLNPPFRFYYMPIHDVSPGSVFSTAKLPCDQESGRAMQISIEERDGSREFTAQVPPTRDGAPRYRVTLLQDSNRTYDRVRIVREGSDSQPFELRVGEQSDWIEDIFPARPVDGKVKSAADSAAKGRDLPRPRRGRVRFYLTALSPDGDHITLYHGSIATADPITVPAEHSEALTAEVGPFWEVDDPWAFLDGWIPLEAYLAQLDQQTDLWGKATLHAVRNYDPDIIFSWVGSIDHGQHVLWGGIDKAYKDFDPAQEQTYLEYHRRLYKRVDDWVGRIAESLDDNTILAVVSDHGFTHVTHYVFLLKHLKDAGLAHYIVTDDGQVIMDWSRTKAYPLPPGHNHIFINVKGRDPQGCVAPEDYERVQDEVIQCLYGIKDPENDRLVTSLAIRKQEAMTLGIVNGPTFDRVGDVLYAFHHGYVVNPLQYAALIEYPDGTTKYTTNEEGFEPALLQRHFTGYHISLPGTAEMEGMLLMAGPGVPSGKVLEHPIDVTDIVPTWADLISMPVPKDAEGRIVPGLRAGRVVE